MDVTEALEHARLQMDLNGLYHWKVKLDRAVQRVGQCNYTTQTISFSRVLLEANPPQVFYDTLIHEMAHALVGPFEEAHGAVWAAQARLLGQENPSAIAHDAELPDSSYRYAGDCGGEHAGHDMFRRHRMNKKTKYKCNKCHKIIVWWDRKELVAH